MELLPWPDEFFSKKRGDQCPQCLEGRAAESIHGIRYFAGASADAYLQRRQPARGYTVAIFRGRHVADLHSLTEAEQTGFWSDVAFVASAIESTFAPIHLNYQLLGNQDPHVHVHIVPRYDPDPEPCRPLPPELWDGAPVLDQPELDHQLRALRVSVAELTSSGTP